MSKIKRDKSKEVFTFKEVVIITICTSFLMCFLGATLIYKHLGGINYTLLESDTKLREFIASYGELVNNYYESVDREELIDSALAGMYSKLDDPYSTFLDSDSTANLDESLDSKYKGVGITVTKLESGEIKILAVVSDSPAEKAGIKVGDVITKVNGTDTLELTTNDVSELIKSQDKSTITIQRDGILSDYLVEISEVDKPVVDTEIISNNDKKIGYISLSIFGLNSYDQFNKELKKLESKGIDSLVIDLRGNSGGYLDKAEDIASLFLKKGNIIYYLETKNETSPVKDKTSEKRTYKIAILVNGGTASAAEILSASLKYSYGATIIGTNSYGKGKIQEKSSLSNGTSLKYTSAKWLTPNEVCIDKKGLNPDIEIEFDQEMYNILDKTTDNQIMQAVKYLSE